MTLSTWIPWTIVVTALLALAAWLLERALRGHGLPTRGACLAALAGSVGLPLAALATPEPPVAPASPSAFPASGPASAAEPLSGLVASASLPPDWDPLLAVGWAVLSGLVGLMVVVAAVRLLRARSGWPATRLDGREVLLSERLGPAVVGLLRPAVVVPRWVLGMRSDDRDLVLRHEEEHRRTGDPWLLAAGLLLVVLVPWNVPLWWLLGRLRLAVEVDCDRRVLRGAGDVRRYAGLLVEIGRRESLAPGLGAVALARPAPFLERRIRAMTDRTPPPPLRTAAFACLAAVVAVGACRMDRPGPVEPPAGEVIETASGEVVAGGGPAGAVARGSYVVDVRAGAGILTGLVTTPEGDPVGGAQVFLPDADVGALTNARGRFLLLNVPLGAHRLRVTHTAHPDDWEGTVRVRAGPEPAPADSLRAAARMDPGARSAGGREGADPRLPPRDAPSMAPGRGVLTGTVVDPEGEPVGSAQIVFEELEIGALSNVQGRFLLLNVPAGTHTLTVEHAAHGRWSVEIEIVEGRTVHAGALSPPGG